MPARSASGWQRLSTLPMLEEKSHYSKIIATFHMFRNQFVFLVAGLKVTQ